MVMIPHLSEICGLPIDSQPATLACACEKRLGELRAAASCGDANAQADLIGLQIAYLNWAYAKPRIAEQNAGRSIT